MPLTAAMLDNPLYKYPRTEYIQYISSKCFTDIKEIFIRRTAIVFQFFYKSWQWTAPALQTRLDLYNSELALASSPVLFWNLCIQSEL